MSIRIADRTGTRQCRLLSRTMFVVVVGALSSVSLGCAHRRRSAPPRRVAVFPLDSIGLPQRRVRPMRRAISAQVAQRVATVAPKRVSAAAAACRLKGSEDGAIPVECVTAAGRELGASHVVLGTVGGVERIYVVQLKLIDVRQAAVTRSLEETIFPGTAASERALAAVTRRLLDIDVAPPWYKHWWLWGLIGLGVASAITLPLVLQDRDPYLELPLPR